MPKKKIRRRLKLQEQAAQAELPKRMKPMMRDFITWLIARKKTYFDKYKRSILDYRLTDLGDRYKLQVVATDVTGHR
jgi:hypothetical protein